MKQTIVRLLVKIFSILVFAAFTGGTLFFAYGYQFDVEERVLQKISIIDIINRVKGSSVYLDGEKYADSLPYQIKNVLPGKHKLEIQKDGFLPWKRDVLVKEDIVTIVRDVLPVPEKIDDYVEEMMVVNEMDSIVYGNNFFLTYEPGESNLNMVMLFDNGTVKEEDVSLYREDFEIIEAFKGEKFLIRFKDELGKLKDDVYAFASFSEREFRVFALPRDIERIRVDLGSKRVFFMKEGILYSANLDDLAEDEFGELEDFELIKGVEQYDLDYFGHIFYLSSGMLFRADYSGEGVKLLDQCPMFYSNLGIHFYWDFNLLVTRGVDDSRKLFITDRNGDLFLLTDYLNGFPSVNSNKEILYINDSGHVFMYDPEQKIKKYIRQLDGEFDLIGWFGDDGHLLVAYNGSLMIIDVYDANPVTLFEEFNGTKAFIAGKAFYYFEGDSLNILYWQDALVK